MADLPNTEKQTQRVGQNEETEDYVPNQRQRLRQNLRKRTKGNGLPDTGFKIMIIKMFTR